MMMVVLGIFIGASLFWTVFSIRLGRFRQYALQIIHQAEFDAQQRRTEVDSELQARRQQLVHEQYVLASRSQQLTTQEQQLTRERERLKADQIKHSSLQKTIEEKKKFIDALSVEATATLERTGQLSRAQAREMIRQQTKEEFDRTLAAEQASWHRLFEEECKARAHTMLMTALERKSQAVTKECFITEIPLKDRTLIPRIIGKDGRNIQLLEEILQVVIIIDEHSPRIFISAHEQQHRAIAKATFELLLANEKVTSLSIQKAYNEAVASLSNRNSQRGASALRTCGVLSTIAPEVCETLGALEFRSSVGQNVLAHSMEVADLMGLLAAELGLNYDVAKAMGLYHDIGKALPSSWGESHALAGKAFLMKWGVDDEIINAVASHHGEEIPRSEEAQLLPICDRISAQLPGVRRNTDTSFLALTEQCEQCTTCLPDVLSAWAHYAGQYIELLIRHEPSAPTERLLATLQKAISAIKSPIPVKITLLARRSQVHEERSFETR
jgi:ribonuclease Y